MARLQGEKRKTYMKKLFLIIPFLPLSTFASTSSIDLPPNFNSDVWLQASALFTSFGSYITMVFGVILAATVLEIIIGSLHKH
jgi:hypothetical protein